MKKIFVSSILFVLIISLTGCGSKTSEQDLLKEKVTEEVEVMESKIVDMLNNCNNISTRNYKVISEKIENKDTESDKTQSQDSEQNTESDKSENIESEVQKNVSNRVLVGDRTPNWDEIKNNIEILSDIWGTVIKDLYKCNVNNEDILKFSDSLNLAIISIKNSDKPNTMQNLVNMYSYLPTFANNVYKEEQQKNKLNAKYHIINAYSKIETENWDEINKEMTEADKHITNTMNDVNQTNENIEKTYIVLKEFQNAISKQDKDVLYIKYRNLIEEFN